MKKTMFIFAIGFASCLYAKPIENVLTKDNDGISSKITNKIMMIESTGSTSKILLDLPPTYRYWFTVCGSEIFLDYSSPSLDEAVQTAAELQYNCNEERKKSLSFA